MAAVTLFQPSPSIKKAVSVINGLEQDRFVKVLSRVVQRFHIKDEPVFTDEECSKLQIALGVEPQELQLVLDTTSFFLQQAAYHLAKPALLQKQLLEVGMVEEKATLFSQIWSSQAKSVIEKLRSRQFFPTQLEDVKWRLNLQMSQANTSRMKEPNALFELLVSNDKKDEKVRMEFNHSELFSFYEKLEKIQDQLDSLN